jgi:predicted ATP-grasp superfamily ATP-dependent carboligase
MNKVLITDADYKNALSAVRSLGEKEYYVVAASESKYARSFYSRYTRERLVCPYSTDPDAFIDYLLSYLADNPVDVLLPISYAANRLICSAQDRFRAHTNFVLPSWNSMVIASDKARTLEFATKLGIPAPQTYHSLNEVRRFPVVVKATRGQGCVSYVNSKQELEKINCSDCVIQEYIPGDGYGFYALFNKGQARAVFMSKRIREYPITGGPSTAAISIWDDKLRNLGITLLEALHWHGVAMVEFKKDDIDNRYKLMEINPKFWGSLDLSIASGIDFPALAAKMALEGDVDSVFRYTTGKRFMWISDEFLRLFAKPSDTKTVIGDLLDANVASDVQIRDIWPNIYSGVNSVRHLVKLTVAGKLTYPHGNPNINRFKHCPASISGADAIDVDIAKREEVSPGRSSKW